MNPKAYGGGLWIPPRLTSLFYDMTGTPVAHGTAVDITTDATPGYLLTFVRLKLSAAAKIALRCTQQGETGQAAYTTDWQLNLPANELLQLHFQPYPYAPQQLPVWSFVGDLATDITLSECMLGFSTP